MLSPYRAVMATPGARAFVGLGLVARLPMAMLSLGEVLLIRATTGSYAIAGAVSASGALANAVFGPAVGRQIDRRGQAGVLPTLLALNALGSAGLVVLAEGHGPTWSLFATAVLSGSGYPAFGFLVRARWSHLLDDESGLQVAFALESVLDELCFVLGPPLVTLLATAVHPTAGLVAATAITLVGGGLFATLHRTQPPPSGVVGRGQGSVVRERGMPTLFSVLIFMVTAFGCTDVATVGFAGDHGSRAYAGPILASIAAGSAIAGLASGLIAWTSPPEVRLWRGAAVLALAELGMPFVHEIWVMVVLGFLAGLSIAPTITCIFALTEALIPPARLSEAFAVLNTAVGVGVAAGTAAAGAIVQDVGTSWAYGLTVSMQAISAAIAVTGRRRVSPPSAPGTPIPAAVPPAPAALT